MFVFGAVGGSVTGQADIFYIMIAQGLALPAIIVLGLNIWTTADNGLYSADLDFQHHRLLQKKMVLVSGIIGIVASVWLYYNLLPADIHGICNSAGWWCGDHRLLHASETLSGK